MTVLIIHGIGGHAGIHWQKWLHDELIKKGHQVIMPDFPNTNHPDRNEWLMKAKEVTKNVNLDELVIVGHSLGVVTALDLIEGLKVPISSFISVAGFAEDYQAPLNSYFLREKKIDFGKVNKNIKKSVVFYGDNDPYVPQKILKSLSDKLKATPVIFPNGGHLNTEAGFATFPKIVKEIDN